MVFVPSVVHCVPNYENLLLRLLRSSVALRLVRARSARMSRCELGVFVLKDDLLSLTPPYARRVCGGLQVCACTHMAAYCVCAAWPHTPALHGCVMRAYSRSCQVLACAAHAR